MGIDAAGRVLIDDETLVTTSLGAATTNSSVINAGVPALELPCYCSFAGGYDRVASAISSNTGEVAGYFDYAFCCRSFKSNIVWGLQPTYAFIDYYDGYRKRRLRAGG